MILFLAAFAIGFGLVCMFAAWYRGLTWHDRATLAIAGAIAYAAGIVLGVAR